VLFGERLRPHDIESTCSALLGISLDEGTSTEGGHSNHLRVINEVRRHGSIAAAVESGYVTEGAMATCVRRGVPFVLGGSIRDDGPLPDVLVNTADAADAMRALIPGVTVALMLPPRCMPSPSATACRRASRPSAWTSTRPSSRSWPIGAATRRTASSPTSDLPAPARQTLCGEA
jgi:hypothetical protein